MLTFSFTWHSENSFAFCGNICFHRRIGETVHTVSRQVSVHYQIAKNCLNDIENILIIESSM
jgi:hypothetical protein